MRRGAAAGAVGVALFLVAALVQGASPAFDSPGGEVAEWYGEERTRIQLSAALFAAATPFLIWFLATVGREAAPVAFGCGLVFVALFLVDVTTLAVGSLRPENMAANPELAIALRDLEWLLMGTAAFPAAAMLLAFAAAAALPRWLRVAAAVAAPLYLLRAGTLFTAEGPFAADGWLGLYVPVAALLAWLLAAAAVLSRRPATR